MVSLSSTITTLKAWASSPTSPSRQSVNHFERFVTGDQSGLLQNPEQIQYVLAHRIQTDHRAPDDSEHRYRHLRGLTKRRKHVQEHDVNRQKKQNAERREETTRQTFRRGFAALYSAREFLCSDGFFNPGETEDVDDDGGEIENPYPHRVQHDRKEESQDNIDGDQGQPPGTDPHAESQVQRRFCFLPRLHVFEGVFPHIHGQSRHHASQYDAKRQYPVRHALFQPCEEIAGERQQSQGAEQQQRQSKGREPWRRSPSFGGGHCVRSFRHGSLLPTVFAQNYPI